MRLRILTLGLAAAGAALAGCAYDDGYGYGPGYGHGGDAGLYGGYRYEGRDFAYGPRDGRPYFRGRGARLLDPWLAYTVEGQEIVSMGFSAARDGSIGEQTAHRANIWFRRHADTNRDMYLTDEEIRIALVNGAENQIWPGRERY